RPRRAPRVPVPLHRGRRDGVRVRRQPDGVRGGSRTRASYVRAEAAEDLSALAERHLRLPDPERARAQRPAPSGVRPPVRGACGPADPAARVAPPLARSARAGSLPRGPDDRSGGERSVGFEGRDRVGPRGPERPEDLPVAGVELREVLDEDQPRPLDPRLEDADDDVERLADDDDDEARDDPDHRPAEDEAAPDGVDDEREDGAREQDPDQTRVGEDVAHNLDEPHQPHLKALAEEEHREADREAGIPD